MMRLIKILIFILILPSFALAAPALDATNDPQAIPNVVASIGNRDIAEAWLISPTQRYPHYVRGEQFEAAGLRVRLTNGEYVALNLDQNYVFEDRTPRLADLDGDGLDEIILVLTSLQKGAALAAYAISEGNLRLKARTAFIGQPYRWLNPAGIADYNGDGQLDVALVQKPHLSKRLEFWTLGDGSFTLLAKTDNLSNHHNGSPDTDLSASADFDGDGVVDLAILSGDYATLKLLKVSADRVQEIAQFLLPAQGNGNFILHAHQLLVPLANGQQFELNF